MCDACVIDAVRQRMLSRRAFLTSGSVTAVAASATPLASFAQTPRRMVDMTHRIHRDFPTYYGYSGLKFKRLARFSKDGYNSFNLVVSEHLGTHIDAPLHFSADGKSVDEIPLSDLACPLVVIDIAARAASDPDTMLTPDDIRRWTAQNGPIPEGACVAMHSGWAAKVKNAGFRNADAAGVQHYPGFHPEAAAMLLQDTRAAAIASDTLSIDRGMSESFDTHYIWLPANRYAIECLAGLDQVPASGATLIVGASKIQGSTGGQARVFALI